MMIPAYKILPFTFHRIEDIELLVSESGDHVLAPKGTVKSILDHSLTDLTLYKGLLAKFIICEEYKEEIIDCISTRLRTKRGYTGIAPTLHIFVLTVRCNQKCIYCQASSRYTDNITDKLDIQEETLTHAIGLMLKSPSCNITMEFQGGESSLVPHLVEYAILETERQNKLVGKNIRYVICTNLIKVTDDLLDICKKYGVNISTSLDGPEFIHDHNRGVKGSYQKFKKNLESINNALGKGWVSPLMTTSEYSLSYPKEIINEYLNLGFNSIFLRPLNPYGKAECKSDWKQYYDNFIEFYKTALAYIIDLNKSGIYFRESFTATILRKILSPFSIGFVDLKSPAGIINNVILYNYDGYVYCSDESRMMAEKGDYRFRLGSVKDSYEELFYGRKAQSLSSLWSTEYIAGCSDCAFAVYCGADPVRNYSTQGDEYGFRPTSLFCYYHKKLFAHLFSLMENEGESVLPIFRRWAYE